MKSLSFCLSLFFHIVIIFLIFFYPSSDYQSTGLNLKQGEKFESIMVVSNLPIGEIEESTINQQRASNTQNQETKSENYALNSIINTNKAKLQSSEKKSSKISQKNENTPNTPLNNANALNNSKTKKQHLNAPLKSEEKSTQTLITGNAKKQIQSYQALLMAHLLKFQKYPQQALLEKQEGQVSIKVIINEHGNVILKDIKKYSSHTILNNEALDLITRASPLPKPPKEMLQNNNKITFVLPINYNIREFLNRK
ncbi:energy transducer TonB family protein [Campylobacter insulaenigrae]|uniref:Energy transducer TonB n=1 Tax=Campylobacter insulaenigrae TaxID=260714 RepID=A0ABY3G4E5_9BACT|nr:TonB family protein [Campylobacter insulaenigrae]MCR6572043.1 TonB family protein [Campylobacter insulaenigrae]MCR6581081.1 TonB family protein [Campylobacter insulaenigrae]TWO26161.1 energy transducer TonB [Campylobacter insulaenigrae]